MGLVTCLLFRRCWIQTYRISRLKEKLAYDCIVNPLYKLGIKTNQKFIQTIIDELKVIGEGLIYPPYCKLSVQSCLKSLKDKIQIKKL